MNPFDILTALHQSIPGWVLLIALVIVLIITGITTWIYFYHWDHYGTNSITTLQLKAFYLLGIVVFLGLALFSLANY